MSKLVLVTAPTVQPVTPQDVIDHSRVSTHQEDRLLGTMVSEAQNVVEETTWRRLITQTWDQFFDWWTDPLPLTWSPVQSITSITYVDENGDTQTLSTDIYELGDHNGLGIVRRKFDQVWPTVRSQQDAITVRHVCGYGDAAGDVPGSLRSAIRIHAAYSYINREGEEPMPKAFDDLIGIESARRF